MSKSHSTEYQHSPINDEVNSMQKILDKLGTSEDNENLRTELRQIQHCSAQLLKDTDILIKEFSGPSLASSTSAQEEIIILKDNFMNQFSESLRNFQSVQGVAAEMVKKCVMQNREQSNLFSTDTVAVNPIFTNSATSVHEHVAAEGESNDLKYLEEVITTKIKKLSENVTSLEKMAEQIGTPRDSESMRAQLHQVQGETNMLAKDVNNQIKQFYDKQFPHNISEEKKRRALKNKLISQFSESLGYFQRIQRMVTQKERECIKQVRAHCVPLLTNTIGENDTRANSAASAPERRDEADDYWESSRQDKYYLSWDNIMEDRNGSENRLDSDNTGKLKRLSEEMTTNYQEILKIVSSIQRMVDRLDHFVGRTESMDFESLLSQMHEVQSYINQKVKDTKRLKEEFLTVYFKLKMPVKKEIEVLKDKMMNEFSESLDSYKSVQSLASQKEIECITGVRTHSVSNPSVFSPVPLDEDTNFANSLLREQLDEADNIETTVERACTDHSKSTNPKSDIKCRIS